MKSSLDTRNFTRQSIPAFPYAKALATALPGWDMSLVFVGTTRAKHMNEVLRKKDYVPNVLSYETGKKSGEILICLEVAKKQAPDYGMTYTEFVGLLFIHGCLHLKGQAHGTTMERQERLLLKRLTNRSSRTSTNVPTNRHRH